MNNRCAVSEDLARHLDEEERGEARSEAIDARVEALMASTGPFCATSADAISEALVEAEPKFWQKLAEALAGDSRSALPGTLIRAESENYWAKLALPTAEKDVDRMCPRCFGGGCGRCEPD